MAYDQPRLKYGVTFIRDSLEIMVNGRFDFQAPIGVGRVTRRLRQLVYAPRRPTGAAQASEHGSGQRFWKSRHRYNLRVSAFYRGIA